MLLQIFYGQDDNINTLPILFVCVFIYLAYRWIKSINNPAPNKSFEPAKKLVVSNDLVVFDNNTIEPVTEESVKPKTVLKGSIANLSLKKVAVHAEVTKDTVEEDFKAKSDSEAFNDTQAKISALFGKNKASIAIGDQEVGNISGIADSRHSEESITTPEVSNELDDKAKVDASIDEAQAKVASLFGNKAKNKTSLNPSTNKYII